MAGANFIKRSPPKVLLHVRPSNFFVLSEPTTVACGHHHSHHQIHHTHMVGSLKMNTTLEYSTRVVQEGDRRCKKSTLNDLAYLTPLRIPLMNPVIVTRVFTLPAICVQLNVYVSYRAAIPYRE
jgi:hypothetical protein